MDKINKNIDLDVEPESVVETCTDLSKTSELENVDTVTENKNDSKKESSLLATLHDLVILIACVLVAFSLLFRVVVVSGGSMNNTLIDGDWLLLIGNTFYRNPKKGDIIVASKDTFDNGKPIIKRVIATEGDVVDIDFDAGIVYVNGEALEENYIRSDTKRTLYETVTFPVTVEEGCVFVMGDNRNNSTDSRSPKIGLVDKREILGKAIFLAMPGKDDMHPRKFNRIGRLS